MNRRGRRIVGILVGLSVLSSLKSDAAIFPKDSTIQNLNDRLSQFSSDESSSKKGTLLADLGLLYFKNGRYADASSTFEKSLLNPISNRSKKQVYLYLGKSEVSLGRWDKAIEAYEKEVELDPRDWKIHRDLGQVYEQVNLLDNALASYQQALGLFGVESSVGFNAGRVCRKKMLYEKAWDYLWQAQEKGFRSTDLDRETVLVLEGIGRYQEAAAHLMQMMGTQSTVQEWGRLLYLALLGGDKNLTQTALDQLKSRSEAGDSYAFYKEMAGLFNLSPENVFFSHRKDPALQLLLEEAVKSSTP